MADPVIPPVVPDPVVPAPPVAGTFTQAEVTAMVEAARTEEKTKLYGQIEGLTTKNSELATAHTALQGQLTDISAKMEALTKAASPDGTVDVAKLVEEIASKATLAHQGTVAELTSKLQTLEQNAEKNRLQAYTASKITEAGGPDKIVVALVRGSTEAEIDQSVAVAKSEFDRIFAQAGKVPPVAPIIAPNNGTPPPVPPATPAAGEPDAILSGVAGLSKADYAKNREDIKARVALRLNPR